MRQLKKELWPYCIIIKYKGKVQIDRNTEIEKWLSDNIGEYRNRWTVLYRLPIGTEDEYYFRNQRDANWFALRWS